ncbi:MAG: hypothetical protein FGM52_12290, partial [Mycobacterium sp.]|nr:hypothetical protein [Mycobacterium sp.]
MEQGRRMRRRRLPGQTVLQVETRSLRTHLWATLAMGVLGFVAYAVTSVAATQLDGAISLIDAGTAFLAIGLARIAAAPPGPQAPRGRLALENLYVLFRSLMILGVILAGVAANGTKVIEYLATRKGELPQYGLAALYTAVAAAVGFLVVANHHRNNKAIGGVSSLLKVEAGAAKLDAWLSAGLCAALVVVAVLPAGTALTSTRFDIRQIADSLIVLVVCAILVWGPLRQVRLEFGRLSGRRTDPEVDAAVRTALDDIAREHGSDVGESFGLVDVFSVRRGKVVEVDIHVSYTGARTVDEQDDIRGELLAELRQRVGPVRMTLVFTRRPIHDPPQTGPG